MLSSKAITAPSLLKRVNNAALMQVANIGHHEKHAIGNREVVGFGINSIPSYFDKTDLPFPAVRFREITGDLVALRNKEKGDWKKLSIDEKKRLYRTSFCQTFSEMEAPTGEWKSVVGLGLVFISLGVWVMLGLKKYFYPPLPETFSEERRRDQLRRMIDNMTNPITGVASKWDYEKDTWK